MGKIAGAAIGAAGDVAAAGAAASASIVNTNNTNKTNLQIAQDTNKTNAQNVASTNEANLAIADKTNQMNFDIAQMGNEYNQKMLEQQLQQEWDMWHAENEYNSIGAQMERAREAGVNPYVATGIISPGTAGNMTAPTPQGAITPTMEGATMQAAQAQGATMMPADMSALSGLRGIAKEFISLMQAQEDLDRVRLDNEGKAIENDYKARMFEAELGKKLADTDLSKSQRESFDIENKFKPEMLSSEIKRKQTETMFTQLRAQGQLIANLTQFEWYKVLPTQIQQTLQQKAVEINNLRLMGKLTEAQTRVKVHEAVTEFYKSRLAHDQAAVSNATLNTQIRKVEADLTHAINNSGPDGAFGVPNMLYNWFDKGLRDTPFMPFFMNFY